MTKMICTATERSKPACLRIDLTDIESVSPTLLLSPLLTLHRLGQVSKATEHDKAKANRPTSANTMQQHCGGPLLKPMKPRGATARGMLARMYQLDNNQCHPPPAGTNRDETRRGWGSSSCTVHHQLINTRSAKSIEIQRCQQYVPGPT